MSNPTSELTEKLRTDATFIERWHGSISCDRVQRIRSAADELTRLEEENARLVKDVATALDFIDRVSGAALGIAMSGDDHPAPDAVLMGYSQEGMNLSAAIRRRAIKGGGDGN